MLHHFFLENPPVAVTVMEEKQNPIKGFFHTLVPFPAFRHLSSCCPCGHITDLKSCISYSVFITPSFLPLHRSTFAEMYLAGPIQQLHLSVMFLPTSAFPRGL